MSQLRWTLLILGVLFVAGLAWWEMRRQRQSPRKDSERLSPTLDSGADTVRGITTNWHSCVKTSSAPASRWIFAS